jgi:hypothetical protein
MKPQPPKNLRIKYTKRQVADRKASEKVRVSGHNMFDQRAKDYLFVMQHYSNLKEEASK